MDLDNLKAVCAAASPGPWVDYVYDGEEFKIGVAANGEAIATVEREADAEMMATFNPSMVAKLLAVVEAAQWAQRITGESGISTPPPREILAIFDALDALK